MWRILLIILVGCSTPDSSGGMSRKQTVAILLDYNLIDHVRIGPDPRGWSGTAKFGGGGYTMQVVIGSNGTLDISPDPCHC